MGSTRRKKKIAIFLGAGASKSLGIPLTYEIVPTVLKRLQARDLFDPGFEHEHDDLERLLETAFPGIIQRRGYVPNITELLSLLDHQIAQGRSVWRNLRLSEVRRLRRLLVIAICEVLHAPEPLPPQQRRRMRRWRDWIRRLVRRQHPRYHVAFITTNYDRIIDDLLWDVLGYKRIHRVDFGMAWYHADDGMPEKMVPQPARPRVRCYKLHGSLTYVGCPKCKKVYISSGSNYYIPLLAKRAETQCICRHHPLEGTLVVPTLARRKPFQRLDEVWREAQSFMEAADAWIIAGYSMPPEDLFIRELLITASQSSRASRRRIDVVQFRRPKAGDPFAQYLGAGGQLRSYHRGLQRYIRQPKTVFSDLVHRRL